MRHAIKVAILTVALLMLSACGKNALDDDDDVKKPAATSEHEGPGLALTAEQSEALGLETVKLEALNHRDQLIGYGAVLTLDAIAQADADIVTAEAAVAQSAAAAARAKELAAGDDAVVSHETYETAAANAATDQAALLLARRKADIAFGINAPWRNAAQRSSLLTRLQAGRTVFVKVTFPMGAAIDAKSFDVTRMGSNDKGWDTVAVWEAPADASIPGRSLFALVDGSDLAPGERVIATMAVGAAQQGVLVPFTALVLGESDAWIYVKQTGSYLRTRIDIHHPEGEGYFVAEGLESGQIVVTSGAGQLYARELNPGSEAEE